MEMIDTNNFDKRLLKINIPAYNGETQYSKITYNGMPVIIQTPNSLTKQGIMKQGKKLICELMFNSIETEFLHWIEELESGLHDILFKKSTEWFEQSFELNEIESLFISPVKIFKSGKYYLLKVNLKDTVKIFNGNYGLTYMDITPENNIISILEFKGIKYTTRDFQLDIEIKQIMIHIDPYETNCFIKVKNMDERSHLGKKIIESDDFNIEEIINKPNIIDTSLKEITFEELSIEDSNIKIPKEVFDIYIEAKREAEEADKIAKMAHLKLEEIKKKYNIDSDNIVSE